MFKNKEVLVTGGTGLVGRELVELLVNKGANVTSVSLDKNNFPKSWGVTYVNADLRDPNVCDSCCEGKDYVFHIAGIKGSPVLTKSRQYTFFTNFIKMNTNMIDAMYKADIKGGVYTSTVGTYGQADCFKEEDLWKKNPSPNDWFAGWAKRMGEVQIDAFAKQYGEQKIGIIKPVNIYGKYDNYNLRTSTLVPSLINKVLTATDTVEVWGDGSAGRDIIHARDVARFALHVVENKIYTPMNVGKGECVTVQTLIETLIKVSGKDLKITHDLSKPKGDSFRVADVSRMLDSGFIPKISLEEGLKETFEWFETHNPYEGRYDPFLQEEFANV